MFTTFGPGGSGGGCGGVMGQSTSQSASKNTMAGSDRVSADASGMPVDMAVGPGAVADSVANTPHRTTNLNDRMALLLNVEIAEKRNRDCWTEESFPPIEF